MEKRNKILLAGATGYLGGYLLKRLLNQHYMVRTVVRDPLKLPNVASQKHENMVATVTDPNSLKGVCKGIHTVISTIGITRQKDGLTYMDVDFQANMNLLQEAIKSNVKHFVYVSVANGDRHKNLKICFAKEKFVEALKSSGIAYTIVRPNGFFSDMKDFLQMASTGRVYIFGKGNQRFNPIHGEDLAKAIVEQLPIQNQEYTIGGPAILSLTEISELAFKAYQKPIKIVYLPDWLRRFTIWVLKSFTSVKTYGPIEFFLTLMAQDNISPCYGMHHLSTFFTEEVTKHK